jgi:parvulin-like peptidyl-prolyl isomerase
VIAFSADQMQSIPLLPNELRSILGSKKWVLTFLCSLVWLTSIGCTNQTPIASTIEVTASLGPEAAPTATIESFPVVATVNDVGIPQDVFEAEVARYEAAQAAAGIDLATLGDYRRRILDALIDQELLVQGALVNDLQVDEASLDIKIVQLISEIGGEEAYSRWLSDNNYGVEEFRRALYQEMMAANMVQKIVADLPATVEHVHARHLLVATQDEAEQLLSQLQAGADFGELAQTFSLDLSTRVADGDLGWFTRGTLTTPEVEAVAFDLQPGEFSGVIQSELGFHIVQSLERGERRPTSIALQRIREKAVEAWLVAAQEGAEIEILAIP